MRRTLWIFLALAAALAAPCLAAEGGGGHEEPGLLSINVVVAITTVVTFLLLLLVLTKTAWKPILQGLQAREQGIRAQIEGAEKANVDAKGLLAEYQARLAHANEEARSIVEEGRKDALALRAKIEAEAQASAATERDRALRDIELARQKAVKEVYDQVATVATEVAGRILEQKLDPTEHRRLVEQGFTMLESRRAQAGSRS
jgi:F-type H+-transporting ATPase subunit b